ncbi:MAG: ATP-binding protein, partial [Bdellovibrionaceae bacterium]|nr:ATP-binding protein [Pseudobdellovibrionaceae bacterium]
AIDLPESEILKFIKPKIELRTSDDKIIFQNHHDADSINIASLTAKKINDSSSFYNSSQNLIIESSFPISYYNEQFNWKILTKIDTQEVVRPFKDLFSNIIILGMLFLSFLFFISHKLIHNLLTPLESLSLYMKKLADGHFEKIPMNDKFSTEFISLINGYNLMLEKLKMSLAESNKNSKFAALGQMATGIAHEINNPLAIIKGLSYSLPKFIELKNFDKAKENVKKIENTVDRIAKIIKSLRAYARDESQDPFKKENIREIVDATLDLCHERIKNQGLKLILEYGQEDLYVPARGFQISQILLNLLNNAADELKTTTDPWIKITSFKIEPQKIKITVENSGPKIPASVAENLFVPFFTTKEVGKGTGLGLMISQNIARSHQGELGLDMSGEHTRFVLILPEFIESASSPVDPPETSASKEKKAA